MSFARQDWDDHVELRRKQTTRINQKEIRRVALGTVPAKQLTGDPHWDTFLSVVQSKIVDVTSEIESRKSVLVDGLDTNHESLLEQKMILWKLRSRLDTLEEIVGIPKDLLAQGEKAQELLKQAGLDLQ